MTPQAIAARFLLNARVMTTTALKPSCAAIEAEARRLYETHAAPPADWDACHDRMPWLRMAAKELGEKA